MIDICEDCLVDTKATIIDFGDDEFRPCQMCDETHTLYTVKDPS